jgi:preprotein translocase subunit SecE
VTNPAEWMRDTKTYLTEVRNESRKITWPTQKEYVGGTVGVVVVVSVMTVVLGVVDFFLTQVLRWVLP